MPRDGAKPSPRFVLLRRVQRSIHRYGWLSYGAQQDTALQMAACYAPHGRIQERHERTSASRMLGITYKSAWFLCHQIREAMTPATRGPIGGKNRKVVEADETFIGGKKKNRAYAKKEPTKSNMPSLRWSIAMATAIRFTSRT